MSAGPLRDVQYVAQRLGVPVSWVYAAVESGRLPSYRIGRYRRVADDDLERWIAAQRVDVAAAPLDVVPTSTSAGPRAKF